MRVNNDQGSGPAEPKALGKARRSRVPGAPGQCMAAPLHPGTSAAHQRPCPAEFSTSDTDTHNTRIPTGIVPRSKP